jgi:DNA repair exonuclease SbcCD nuclease subunit
MTKILVIGDQHFTTKNIPEIDTFIKVITDIALKTKPDLIVLLGDLLHTHEKINTVPLNKAYEFINHMRTIAKTYILVGNHDYINASQFLTSNHWLNSLKEWYNVVIVDKITYTTITTTSNGGGGDKLLVFAPYVEPTRFIEALNTEPAINWKEANLIFCHQEFAGCNMNGNYISNQGHWDLSYPQIIAGHIHTRQHLQKNIYYTGSSMETEWKDESILNPQASFNSIALITFNDLQPPKEADDDKEFTLEEIPIKLNRKLKIHLTMDELDSFQIPPMKDDNDVEGVHVQDKIKIQISGIPYEEFNTLKKTAKYKELLDNNIKVDFEFNKTEVKVNNQKLQQIINDESLNNDFRSIFDSIAKQQTDPVYHQIYQQIMNNRTIETKDILII